MGKTPFFTFHLRKETLPKDSPDYTTVSLKVCVKSLSMLRCSTLHQCGPFPSVETGQTGAMSMKWSTLANIDFLNILTVAN